MDLKLALEELNESKLTEIFSKNCDSLDELIKKGQEYSNEWFYKFIINFLTSIEFSENEAKKYYFEILEHKYFLSEKMDRDIGLRVAAMDYFLNITKIMKNPKIIEISLFEEIMKMSKEDPKTGCYNANFLKDFAYREIKRAERYQQCVSLLIIDIDNFKNFNNHYGHLFADKILRKFTDVVQSNLREEDFLSRFGGDEFVILMPQTGRIGARSLAERIKSKLTEYFLDKEYHGEKINLTFSAGISTYPFDAKEFEELFKKADQALYKSKKLGKNRIHDYLEEEYMQNLCNTSDKRCYQRYQLSRDSSIEIGDRNSLFSVKGKIVNISMGGVLLECNCEVSEEIINKNLDLNIKSLGKISLDGVNLDGNVVRINKENEKLKFYLGIAFKDLLNESIWTKIENEGELLLKEKK